MTREEAIERLEDTFEGWERWNPHNDSPASKLSEALDMAIAALREQEKLESNLKVLESKRWISVEERLPEKITNKVLVYCKNGYTGFGHYEKFQGVEDWYNLESGKPFREWDLEDCETYEVTHWMPLPEPPKEDTNA